MKCLLFVVFLLASVSPSLAQTASTALDCSKSIRFGESTKELAAAIVIKELSTACKYTVVYEGYFRPTGNVQLKKEYLNLDAVIEDIAAQGGFDAVMNHEAKVIRLSAKATDTPQAAAPSPATAAPAAPPSAPATVQLLPQRPRYYPLSPNGIARRAFAEAGTFAEANAAVREVTEAFEHQRITNNRYYQPTIYGSGAVYGYHQTHGYWPWMAGCLTGPSGEVRYKFDGDKDDRKLWFVSINGETLGTIDQADAWFNHKIPVCAGPTRVVIEKLHRGVAMDRNFSVRPGAYTEIGVGDYLFPPERP